MAKNESGGHHLWNSCGSEAGQDERKPSEGQVPITGNPVRQNAGGRGRQETERGTEQGPSSCEARIGRKGNGRSRRLSNREGNRSGRKDADGTEKTGS